MQQEGRPEPCLWRKLLWTHLLPYALKMMRKGTLSHLHPKWLVILLGGFNTESLDLSVPPPLL